VTGGRDRNVDPRVTRTRATVLGTAIDLLAGRGYSGFSVEGVVERSGVAKTTLYRHWRTRNDLLAAAELDGGGPLPDTGSVRQDLLDLLARRVLAARTRQWNRCMPALVEAAAYNPELAKMIATPTSQILGRSDRDPAAARHRTRGVPPRPRPATRRVSPHQPDRVPPPAAARSPHHPARLSRHRPAAAGHRHQPRARALIASRNENWPEQPRGTRACAIGGVHG